MHCTAGATQVTAIDIKFPFHRGCSLSWMAIPSRVRLEECRLLRSGVSNNFKLSADPCSARTPARVLVPHYCSLPPLTSRYIRGTFSDYLTGVRLDRCGNLLGRKRRRGCDIAGGVWCVNRQCSIPKQEAVRSGKMASLLPASCNRDGIV
jgi:hypothetical protein